jgi:uncharacterized iron-regulated membrane protein
MELPRRWLRHPQTVWLRKALFQVHLWAGIGVGIYILAISVSGSAIVFRNEIHRALTPAPLSFTGPGNRLTKEQLEESATRLHPEYTVSQIWMSERNPDRAVEIWIKRSDDDHQELLFHPYTGADLGDAVPPSIRVLDWLVNFHDTLLYAETGRTVNGIGGLFLVVLCLTGAIVWWPGIKNWRSSLGIDVRANWKRFNWNLHSAIGFWSFLLILMWALSGVYLVFPEPFTAVVDYFEPPQSIESDEFEFPPQAVADSELPERVGDAALRWLSRLHFGRYYGWPVKVLWTILGLVPPILFITGVVMWWNRVVKPAQR